MSITSESITSEEASEVLSMPASSMSTASVPSTTSSKTIFYISSVLILPVLYVFFYILQVWTKGSVIESWLKWDRLLIIASIIVMERIYTYRYAVSQKAVLGRDIIANIVTIYLVYPVTAMIVLPLLAFIPEHFLGRKLVFASPDQLGPFWLQIVVIVLSVSFFRYWMHRLQHTNSFLWELHSYHHRTTDLKALNGGVSNPVDFALRNVIIFLILGMIGFDPYAILLAVAASNISGLFSHCGADVKGGVLNYLFVTPEVHRWHHAVDVPQGYGYSCNYGVEFSFWDILFGTYYMPKQNSEFVMPERIGHPAGLPDERNYLKILLAPFGLYRPLPWFRRTGINAEPAK
jgi:sterol desaturase/sphingolipid hydroxylase (fatty acid hydroxylase superfamily)